MNQITGFRWQGWVLLAVVALIFYGLRSIVTPFVVAALLAYLGDPVVDALERWRLRRGVAVGLVFGIVTLFFVGVLLLLIPFLEGQITHFIRQLPHWLTWVQEQVLPWMQQRLGVSTEFLDTQKITRMLQEHWQEAGGFAASVVARVSSSGMALIGFFIELFIIPVVGFYLLIDWDRLVAHVHQLIPRSFEAEVASLARASDEALGAFLRGQLGVMMILSVFFAVSLSLVGLDIGPLIGITAGMVSFVPYLGGMLGIVMGVIAALVQYQDVTHVVWVLGVFAVGHVLESYVLVPRLIGEKVGVHPVAVIFAIMAGGKLFGFLGVLLALPAAAVMMVLLRYAHQRYLQSLFYQMKPNQPQSHGSGESTTSEASLVLAAELTAQGPSLP